MIDELGENKRRRKVQLHLLSAKEFRSGTTAHPSAGVGEFVSSLLSNLEPADALTFIQPRRHLFGKRPAPPVTAVTAPATTGAAGAPGAECNAAVVQVRSASTNASVLTTYYYLLPAPPP